MSSDESQNVSGERDRREVVREKAQQVKARQSRARVLRTSSVLIGAVAVVAVLAVGVSLAVSSSASKPQLQPASAPDGGFTVATIEGVAPTASPTPTSSETPKTAQASPAATGTGTVDIRVYVDYLSPGAKDFQLANAPQLTKWVEQGAATLTYYPVAMLTSKSNGTKYSLRAASAAACVATHANEAFFAFNDALLKQQPTIESDGFSDAELADLAVRSGASDSSRVRACILDGEFSAWAKATTDKALVALPDTKGLSLTAVPTVLVNGVQYAGELKDAKEFNQFVLMSSSGKYFGTPSPTPSAPKPTPTAP